MSDGKQLRVFLCHASEDQEFVRKVHKRLKEDGINAWLDKENLLPGQDWELEIPKAIENSDVVLVFLSKDSVGKEGYVNKEIRVALDKAEQMPEGRIYIVPIRLDKCKVPKRLTNLQWVDVFKADWYKQLKNTLDLRAEEISARTSSIPNVVGTSLPPSTNSMHLPQRNAQSVSKDSLNQTSKGNQTQQLFNQSDATILKENHSKRNIFTQIVPVVIISIIIFVAIVYLPILRRGQEPIEINLIYDGKSEYYTVPINSSVSDILTDHGVALGLLDRVVPPLHTIVNQDETISVTRVREEVITERINTPFHREIVKNSNLPEGETRIFQAGVNGLNELTYRIVYEDNIEVSRSVVKTVILQASVPEIVAVGSSPGIIAYLAGGKAWIIDISTDKHTPIETTGDLDGRIFFLSPNGDYLIYSRKSNKPAEQEINTIWAVQTDVGEPFNTGISNVIHYAEWIPGTNSIAYSTVEPRDTAPGWQANNDLRTYNIITGDKATILDVSNGGVYGWWGSVFSFSRSGGLAYAHPDEIGLIDIEGKYIKPLIDVTPYNAHGDWAWLPSITWSPDGNTLYYTSHAPPPSLVAEEDSPFFDISATSLSNNVTTQVVESTGMFAYPTASPYRLINGKVVFFIAYLQAIFPEKSETSHYRLYIIDADGSNRKTLFPLGNDPGLLPQGHVWSPTQTNQDTSIAVIYHGDIWIIDILSGKTNKITDNSLVVRLDWK